MMVAEPAAGQPPEESPSDLRLLSVSYKIRNDLRSELGELIGAEAHVGPDEDPQEVWQKLRSWVQSRALPDDDQLGKLEQEHLDLREAVRKQQENLERLKARVDQFVTFMDRWCIPLPEGWRREYDDLPF